MTSICSTAQHAVQFCDTPIDWSATGDFVGGIGAVAGVIAVVWAARKGASTFQQWRVQKIEERRIHLAEQILALAYKLEEAFEQIRFPSPIGNEGSEALANMEASGLVGENADVELRSRLMPSQLAVDRIRQRQALFDELSDLIATSRAVFGDAITRPLSVLRHERGKIIGAANGLAYMIRHPRRFRTEREEERDLQRQFGFEDTIWGSDPDGKEAKMITDAVAELDKQLGPLLRDSHLVGSGK